jgi:hypothetical protein
MKRICSTTPFTQESADVPMWDQSYTGSDARTIRYALEQLSANGSVRKAGEEFVVEAETEGAGARELNRTFLSALRKVEKRATPRAECLSAHHSNKSVGVDRTTSLLLNATRVFLPRLHERANPRHQAVRLLTTIEACIPACGGDAPVVARISHAGKL